MAPAMQWPPCPGDTVAPEWTGQGFQVAGKPRPYLAYHEDQKAWDQGLTGLHEEEAGEDHFIDIASRNQALEGALRFVSAKDGVLLEVGMSSGFFIPLLKQGFPLAQVIGSDAFPEVLAAYAKKDPSVPLLQFDLTACPLPDASVDGAVLLNVFEHIEDEAKAMAELYRILKPGGVLVLEVPAGPGLYDIYDELLRHYRRYSMSSFQRLIRGAGFEVAWRSHLGFFLYPAFAAVKLLNRWRYQKAPSAGLRQSSGQDSGQASNPQREKVAQQIAGSRRSGLADALMRFERALGRHLYLPFGIRCLVVARKPGLAATSKA